MVEKGILMFVDFTAADAASASDLPTGADLFKVECSDGENTRTGLFWGTSFTAAAVNEDLEMARKWDACLSVKALRRDPNGTFQCFWTGDWN